MGIFRDITKSLKKAAPIIGGTIGFALGGPTGAAIGSGIGSLAGGRSVEESLMNAALGYGAGSLAQGAGFGSQAVSSGAGPASMATKNAAMGIDSAAPSLTGGSIKIAPSGSSGVMSGLFDFAKANPLLTTSGVLSLAALAGGDDKKGSSSSGMRPYPKGDVTLGTGIIGEGANRKSFNLNDEAERKAYFKANQNRGYNTGGYLDTFNLRMLKILGDNRDYPEAEQRDIQSALDKKLGGRTGFDAMTTDRLRRQLGGSAKAGHTEMDLREIERVLAKRSAPKFSMAPYRGDPSKLMRTFMSGGEVNGPGTGTSDSVPARLSDGEFVVTADAVRGAGGGDRDVGAARMYDMMSQLERVA